MPTDGSVEPTFTDRATVWAEIKPKRGKEAVNDRQVEGTITWEVTTRNEGLDITPAWRGKWGSRYLNVTAAYDPDQLGQVMVCECQEEHA